MITAGSRVRTPEGWVGIARRDARQAASRHGGPVLRGGGIGPKRARPGDLEAIAAERPWYVTVDLDRGGFATYNVDVLECVELNDDEPVGIGGRMP